LDRQQRLTGNQRRIIFAAIVGDMLEFFDYFLIGFVLAFIVGPCLSPVGDHPPVIRYWRDDRSGRLGLAG
jgi:hypothetical protein